MNNYHYLHMEIAHTFLNLYIFKKVNNFTYLSDKEKVLFKKLFNLKRAPFCLLSKLTPYDVCAMAPSLYCSSCYIN